MKEELRGDEQESKVWDQKKKAKDVKKMRGIVHENDKNEGTNHAQDEMEKLIYHGEQPWLSLWQGWHWTTPKANGLTPICVPRPDESRWSTFVITKCTRECPERDVLA